MIFAGLTTLLPGAASAREHGGARGGAMMGRGGCATGHASTALMAGVSVLGYWVLHQSSKDSGAVRRAGQAVGWVLVVGGLAGFLCGALTHARDKAGTRSCGISGASDAGMLSMPPGHPPVGEMPFETPAAPAAPKAKKAK
ncbi:MAG: hypothetical protein A2X40_08505 [Elusimicrobia bacterium GWC2_65_9]|nr:MAG: hypothetical protein A2X40_08505 [Elusimicrobia bacterium GWC2_65_9]